MKKINATIQTISKNEDEVFTELCEFNENEVPKPGQHITFDADGELMYFYIKFIVSDKDSDDIKIYGYFLETM